jgi:hypothetical protein
MMCTQPRPDKPLALVLNVPFLTLLHPSERARQASLAFV